MLGWVVHSGEQLKLISKEDTMSENMYKQAARVGLLFDTSKGMITINDLWTLPLQSNHGLCLDEIAVGLSREIESAGTVSFVTTLPTVDRLVNLRFEIIKDVISTQLEAQESRKSTAEKVAKKQEILALIADKQKDALGNQSIDELTEMLNEL